MNPEISALVRSWTQTQTSCCLCWTRMTHFCSGAALFQCGGSVGGSCQTNTHTHRRAKSRLSLPSVHPSLSLCRCTLRCSVFRPRRGHGAVRWMSAAFCLIITHSSPVYYHKQQSTIKTNFHLRCSKELIV